MVAFDSCARWRNPTCPIPNRKRKKKVRKRKIWDTGGSGAWGGILGDGGMPPKSSPRLASVTRDLVSCTRGKWRDRRQKFLSTCDCYGPGWRMGPHAAMGRVLTVHMCRDKFQRCNLDCSPVKFSRGRVGAAAKTLVGPGTCGRKTWRGPPLARSGNNAN